MRKLKNIPGSCAVVALLYCSGLDEDTVIRVCSLHGFERGEGMDDKSWKEASKDLGISIRRVSMRKCRLSTFLNNHPKGLYIVGTFDHLFVVDNGIIIDPRHPTPPWLRRVITDAWRVITAHRP